MMSHFTFSIALIVLAIAALGIFLFKVAPEAKTLESAAAQTLDIGDHAAKLSASVIGRPTAEERRKRLAAVGEELTSLDGWFDRVDRAALDRWFPNLGIDWKEMPDPELFKRFYNLAADQMAREVAEVTSRTKLSSPVRAIIDRPWMNGGNVPEKKDLRDLQREFWIQNLVVRGFADKGGVMMRPLGGGEVQTGVGSTIGGVRFDRIRYDALVQCRAADLLNVMHALETSFRVKHEDGKEEEMLPPVIVENVAIRTLVVDGNLAAKYAGDPPLELTFNLAVIDYSSDRR